ncbi:hypothetical protein QQ045_014785 [Rhodiola kirilowii]
MAALSTHMTEVATKVNQNGGEERAQREAPVRVPRVERVRAVVAEDSSSGMKEEKSRAVEKVVQLASPPPHQILASELLHQIDSNSVLNCPRNVQRNYHATRPMSNSGLARCPAPAHFMLLDKAIFTQLVLASVTEGIKECGMKLRISSMRDTMSP